MLGNEDVNYSLISAVSAGSLERARELINSFGLSYSEAWSEGYVLLCDALKYKNAAVAKLLITSGAKVNSKSKKHSDTPLHFAVTNGDIEIVKMILDKGADINAKNQYGRTPLHIAIKNKIMEVTELLLKHRADVNDRDNDGISLLHVAAEIGCLQIVEHLLKHGADVNCVSTSTWKTGYAPLHFAVEKGSKEVVTLLLSRGANVDVKGENSITPLHIAAKKGHTHIAEDLINHGACTHSFTLEERYTPLHFASQLGNEEAVKLLLNKGADINVTANGNLTPLHAAIERGYVKVVEALLKCNANVNSVVRSDITPLHLSAETGNEEISTMLLNKGANINAKQKDGTTALHIATENGYKEVVRVLLEFGAKVDSKIESDITPLHLGAKNGYPDIIETILKFGADVDSRTEYGTTALHIASQEGHVEVVDTLLRYGSDINITSGGDTPLDHARFGLLYSQLYNYGSDDDDYYDYYDDDYYELDRKVRWCKATAEYLKRHIVKMKTANLYVSEQNLLSVSSGGEISVFQDECEEEIASMKSEKINNSNISFYDILAKGTSSLAIYLRNENIVQVLKSEDYKTKFPIYASMIESHFRQGMERKELLERGNKIFHFLFKNYPELPYDCTEKIFSYLSNKDLRILMDVCKPLSIGNPNTNINDVAITSSTVKET